MRNKIKVLHVIKNLSLGGAEVNLLNLLRAIDQDAFELHAAYSFGGELENKFQEAGIKLFKYAEEEYRVKSLATLGVVMSLINYIHRHKIQIVHTHTFSAHVWGSTAAKLTGCKIVEHVHDFRYLEPDDFRRRRGINNQYRFVPQLKNLSDRVVVLTEQNRDFLLKEKFYPEERIRKYPNGIPLNGFQKDDDAQKETLARFDLGSDALVILTPVRLAPEKNLDLILRIAPDVIRQVPDAVFLIAGDGPLYQQTLEDIQKADLENNVRLIGYHSDIRSLFEGTDIFLLPSFLELHSIAVLEAMSMRVPVVISQNVGCNNEFIDSWRNGILLDPFRDEGWAGALIKLLENPLLRQDIGDSGHYTCRQKFNIRDTARRFEELYAELVAPQLVA
jgi:glycosyltransferase involved in cell wall biosynthesis